MDIECATEITKEHGQITVCISPVGLEASEAISQSHDQPYSATRFRVA